MRRIALAPCNGMSPNGLVARVATGDCTRQCDGVISICMGSTSADIEGRHNSMLEKQDIVAVNGCANACVNKILENKGLNISAYVDVSEVLKDLEVSARDPFRLDDESEKCVEIIKQELIKLIGDGL